MKYKKLTGVVLKKQNYREADQIITIWTREVGKIRCLGKGLRKSRSKLNYSLQDLAWVNVEITGNKLPTIVSAEVVENFNGLREDLRKIGWSFYVAELTLKITADEHPNMEVFNLLTNFLRFLNQTKSKSNLLVYSYSLKLLNHLGFGIEHAGSSFKIPVELESYLIRFNYDNFEQIEDLTLSLSLEHKLQQTVSRFVEYILERDLKSESFLIRL